MGNLENLDLADIASHVQSEINQFLAASKPQLIEISTDFEAVQRSLEAFLKGGKRLRPAFMVAGYLAAGGSLNPALLRAATSLEFIQASALIHDDLMDGSDTRRGLPTVHKQFEKLHQDSEWQGDASWFGNNSAILLGTLCLVWADQLYFESGMPAAETLRAKPNYDSLRVEVLAGQYLDVLEQNRRSADRKQIQNIVRHKTAKYTVERPLLLGAELFGASADQKNALSTYGLAVGEAFQYRDDLLGLLGDAQVTGKPVGDDLREGKRTLLVALLHERAPKAEWSWFESLLGDPKLEPAQVQTACELMQQFGVIAEVEHVIEDLQKVAAAALAAADFPIKGKHLLEKLTSAALNRSL